MTEYTEVCQKKERQRKKNGSERPIRKATWFIREKYV